METIQGEEQPQRHTSRHKSLDPREEALFAELVGDYYSYILRKSRLMVGENSVFDVTQETFLEAYNSIDNYSNAGSLRGWLNTLHRRTVARYVKRKRFPKCLECKSNDVLEGSMTNEAVDAFQEAMNQNDHRQAITQIMSTLEEDDAKLLRLLYWEGHSVKETARMMDLTPSNVKVKAHRLKRSIVESLDAHLREA